MIMKIKHAWLVILLIAMPGILLAQSNQTFENVVVQKGDGWKYSDVSVSLADDGASIIILRPDGASLNIPVGQVVAIFDAQGRDISSQVIPLDRQNKLSEKNEFGYSGDPEPTYSPMTYQAPLPLRMFDVMISGGLGYGQPVGRFYEDFDAAPVYFGDVRFTISSLKYLKFSYRSQHLFDEIIPIYEDGYGDYLGDAKVSVAARQYLVTFGFLTRPHAKNNLRSYGELGAGYVDHVVTATINSSSDSAGESRIMFVATVGVLIPFNKTLGLDCGLSVLTKLLNDQENEGWGMLLSAHAGVTLSFGGGI